MGARARSEGAHLCIDLSHVRMSREEQQALLADIQTTVVGHLAKLAAGPNLVTLSMLPEHNGFEDEPKPPPPPAEPPKPPAPKPSGRRR